MAIAWLVAARDVSPKQTQARLRLVRAVAGTVLSLVPAPSRLDPRARTRRAPAPRRAAEATALMRGAAHRCQGILVRRRTRLVIAPLRCARSLSRRPWLWGDEMALGGGGWTVSV